MICTPGSAREVRMPVGIEILVVASENEILDALRVQHEVYGDPPPGPEEVKGRQAAIQAGSMTVLARDLATGEPAGAAMYDVPANQTTELAGVAVQTAFRRRGIAAALTARLTREAFAASITTVFLTPGGAEAERVYARAGFATTSEVLHISQRPPSTATTMQ
jgi:predicted GNAT family acetyltransferase